VVKSESLLRKLEEANRVALRYSGADPNGSVNGIAGITDETGRVFGLMPHPEAFLIAQNHPRWSRGEYNGKSGVEFFRNAVRTVRGF
jgi:phosphoribosylformylglycinamidine synthase